MPTENLVLRTVYVDPDVDDKLRIEALHARVSKADLFRQYLVRGIKAAKAQPSLVQLEAARGTGPTLVLRTVHMDPKLDDKLRVEAFDKRTSKNDLMRRYVRVGMNTTTPSSTQKKPPQVQIAPQKRTVSA